MTFLIGYTECNNCGNEQHKKHNNCANCGESIK